MKKRKGVKGTEATLRYMREKHRAGSTAYANLCERLQREGRGLPGMYSSAEKHGKAIPAKYRHGHAKPKRGDIIIYLNGRSGHIVVATGKGWKCWTNDYGGKGKVVKTDARLLVNWCGATKWFVADAWWSPDHYQLTHTKG